MPRGDGDCATLARRVAEGVAHLLGRREVCAEELVVLVGGNEVGDDLGGRDGSVVEAGLAENTLVPLPCQGTGFDPFQDVSMSSRQIQFDFPAHKPPTSGPARFRQHPIPSAVPPAAPTRPLPKPEPPPHPTGTDVITKTYHISPQTTFAVSRCPAGRSARVRVRLRVGCFGVHARISEEESRPRCHRSLLGMGCSRPLSRLPRAPHPCPKVPLDGRCRQGREEAGHAVQQGRMCIRFPGPLARSTPHRQQPTSNLLCAQNTR